MEKCENVFQFIKEYLRKAPFLTNHTSWITFTTSTSWITLYLEYLVQGTLSINKKEARKITFKSKNYMILQGTLYQKEFKGSWLKFLPTQEAQIVMRELHEVHCSVHSSGMALTQKIIRQGCY